MTTHANDRYSALCLIAALGISSAAAADTLTVCSSGCDYADLQSAIDDASDGDVIEIAAGTYGSSSDWVETLGKAITIRGEVDSAGEPLTTVAHFFYIWEGETSSTVFENLNCKTQWFLESTNATIRNCVFDDTQRYWDDTASALTVRGGSDVTVIENCTFRGNKLGWSGSGSYQSAAGLELSGDGTVSDCLFDRNKAGNYGCAMNCGHGDITVENCTFTDNSNVGRTYGGALGIFGSSTSSVAVTDCTFIENYCSNGGGAIYCAESSGMDTVRNCLFQENYVTDAFPGGAIYGAIDVQDSTFCGNWSRYDETTGYRFFNHESPHVGHPSNCYSRYCDDCDGDGVLDGCGSGVGNILLVPATYSTIESALDAACYGDVIEIAAGTYVPAGTLDVGLDITLRGAVDASGRPATIIDGRGVGHVISPGTQAHGGDQEIVLENLMIIGGSVYADESRVRLENCVFQANVGRAIYSRKSTLTVIDCAFESNAGGGVELKCGQNLFIGCDFADNAAPQGAGVFCTGWVWEVTAGFSDDFYIVEGFELCDDDLAGTTFEACTFSSNGPCDEGGGVYVDSFNPIFQNCVFNSGSAQRGGAIVIEDGSPILEDCVFANNEALDSGGALLIRGESLPILTQCTFQNNRAGEDGGAVVIEETVESDTAWMTLFRDCQFTSNSARRGGALANLGVYGDASSSVSLEDCTIRENTAQFGGGLFTGAHAGTLVVGSGLTRNRATMGLGGGLETVLNGTTFVGDTRFCDNFPLPEVGHSVDLGGNLYNCGDYDGEHAGGSSENDYDADDPASDNGSADSGQDSSNGDLGGGGLPGRGGRGTRGSGGGDRGDRGERGDRGDRGGRPARGG